MTSPSDITSRRRKARAVAQGKLRKNKQSRVGTTPKLFALDKPVQVVSK